MTDRIILSGVQLTCHLGVPAEERQSPQPISVTIELHMDLKAAGRSDSIADTVDYALVRNALAEVAMRREYLLVESLAETMVQEVLERFPIPVVTLTISKPLALKAFGVDDTAVRITRRSLRVFPEGFDAKR